MELKNKYVIGTHVMFFEIEMYKDFIDGLVNLLEPVKNKKYVTIDLCFNLSQKIEKIDYDKISEEDLVAKFNDGVKTIEKLGYRVVTRIVDKDEFYFHELLQYRVLKITHVRLKYKQDQLMRQVI